MFNKCDVRLGSTDDFAFLIFIIILFFAEDVKRGKTPHLFPSAEKMRRYYMSIPQ